MAAHNGMLGQLHGTVFRVATTTQELPLPCRWHQPRCVVDDVGSVGILRNPSGHIIYQSTCMPARGPYGCS